MSTATPTLDLEKIVLGSGSHTGSATPADGCCIMELVAYMAHEPWSDSPACTCPVLATFCRAWNDGITDEAVRTKLLKPFAAKLIGTKATKEIEERRGYLALDWYIREMLPTWLELNPSLKVHAAALRAYPEIKTVADALGVANTVRAATTDSAAAGDAAGDAARDAAGAAARDAAGAEAWDAAWAAARDAARDAAWAAARDAAWAAARDAARDAAGKKLAPTVTILQASACKLLDRMIEAK